MNFQRAGWITVALAFHVGAVLKGGEMNALHIEDRYRTEVPAVLVADHVKADSVNAVYYDGPLYRGKPTKVFAYYGVPAGKAGAKVPGMVLVHGGGGTAFSDWVRLWNGRGYAAIAMDLCGCVPIRHPDGKSWIRLPAEGGPPGWDASFSQIKEPLSDQWPQYAVNAIARARTLLGSLPGVDGENVGVTGISWGGYLTCLTAGLDSRYRFAAPVYGCGFLASKSAWMQRLNEPGMEVWNRVCDPGAYLGRATMPLLWVTGTNDFAYPMESLRKSYEQVKTPVTLCVTIRMPHGHGGPGENPPEILAFADTFCRGGTPLAEITGAGRENDTAWVSFRSTSPIQSAELVFTTETKPWPERKWESLPAALDPANGKASATLPANARQYYFNLRDARGLVVSSRHAEATP